MPNGNFQSLGVFSSDGSKYYVASLGSGSSFFTNLATPTQNLGSFYQGVLYTSDVTMAAYILSSTAPTTGTLTVITNGVIS